MRLRHGQCKFDMIVTMCPDALEFVEKDGRDLFPDIPKQSAGLFCTDRINSESPFGFSHEDQAGTRETCPL